MESALENKHFLEYWRVLQSRKEIVLAVLFAVMIAGWLITLSMPKEYMAYTRMTVRPVAQDIDPFNGQQQDPRYDPFYLKTQIEVIKSKVVLDPVVSNLCLQTTFAKALKMPGSLTDAEARRELLRSMRVISLIDTSMIRIEVLRKAPKETVTRDVKDIANELARVYADVSTVVERDRVQGGVSKLEMELEKYKRLVKEKESERERLRKDLNITLLLNPTKNVGGEVEPLARLRLSELESNRILARKTMTDRQMKLEKLQTLSGDQLLYTLVWMVQDSNLSALRREMASAKLKLKDLQETCGDMHPDVIRQKSSIEELDEQLKEAMAGAKTAVQTDYDIAKANLAIIEKELDEEKRKDIEGNSVRYQPFYKVCEELDDLKRFRDELQISASKEVVGLAMPQTPVRVVDYAEEPDVKSPVGPSLVLNLILSFVLGLACGVGLAFFVEYVDSSIKNVDEIERYLSAPILGLVPQKVKSLVDAGTSSKYAEAYRVLRTNIQFSKKLGKGKVICTTSGGAGEGKSFTVANLACVCAQLNDKVLIIDSDLRRPRQHRIFGLERNPGFAEVLAGSVSIEKAIQTTQVRNLWLLPSGETASGATGMLNSERLRDILEYLKGQFDWVFLDAPPVVGISDASVLVSRVDAVLLVIQHRNYPREVSIRAKQIIENVGGNLLGIVFNNINMTRDSYYYHNYYRYYSDAYGDGHTKTVQLPTGALKAGPLKDGEAVSPQDWQT